MYNRSEKNIQKKSQRDKKDIKYRRLKDIENTTRKANYVELESYDGEK